MNDTHNAKKTRRTEPGVPVPVEFEMVEICRDTLSVAPGAGDTVGQWLDELIRCSKVDCIRIGRLTIDLAEFSKAFIPPKKMD